MPKFHGHHCPICGKIGNRRCLTEGHYIQCPIHIDNFFSMHADCVKCNNAQERQSRLDRAKSQSADEDEIATAPEPTKKPKRGKTCKPSKLKSFKKIRRERRNSQKGSSEASVSSSDDGNA